MRVCPNCQTENEDTARHCVSCKTRLRKRERAAEEIPESPYSSRSDPINRPTMRAFYLSLWGLIPFVGLLLGPLACVLGLWAWRHATGKPGYLAAPHARVAVWLGAAETLTQWPGLLFMWLGLS